MIMNRKLTIYAPGNPNYNILVSRGGQTLCMEGHIGKKCCIRGPHIEVSVSAGGPQFFQPCTSV